MLPLYYWHYYFKKLSNFNYFCKLYRNYRGTSGLFKIDHARNFAGNESCVNLIISRFVESLEA